MDVVVAGGHGKIGLRLLRLVAERGDRGRGLIRDPAQAGELEAAGAEAIVLDLEREEVGDAVAGADGVVFAAGAGAGSGPERKRTVDYGGAVKLIDAAKANGISRYVMVSAMGVEHPERWTDQMRPYYEAKADADAELAKSGLEYTILRPGMLTDDPGTGLIEVDPSTRQGRQITREDVAAAALASLDIPNAIGKAFELLNGETPIEEALRAL